VAMHRLLQGDVGSGKTLVALLAMLAAVDAGCQAALMAPTQILAEQHANTIRNLVEPLGLDVRLLTGRTRAAARREILVGLLSNTVSILIGTHALVQEDVLFADLGLVVVDEQHRFGVAQRAILREKSADSHLLVMTATPIPRSLALTLYGDLDVTILDELPPGREPVKTGWRLAADRAKALQFVRSEIEQGRQAYIVYPLVEESGKSDLKAATEAFEDLRTGSFSDLRLGLLHGRMTGDEKETTMDAFRRGDLQVLVATTVIEVGVDVPNATVMMVEHAERFGLSQLHQLRGRVGRGQYASYCILIANPQEHLSGEAKERLDAMAQTTDGFEISEVDLKIRGPGQIFGTRQAGFPEFRFADLARDVDIVVLARGEAQKLLNQDPTLASSDLLRQELDAIAWGDFQIVEAG
jgi:ATP-dependent DNA helicase RecG